MKNKQWKSEGWLLSLMLMVCLASCTSQSRKSGLDVATSTGEIKMVNGDSVWVCNLSALKDTITLPLSELAEELQIIKLDNRDEALVPTGKVLISDNYILEWGKQQTPFKLFDKSGKYLCNVGSFGQGPGEYQLIYDAQIDETNGRIYLLPWNARFLLAYDLNGQAVESMPLPSIVPKGVFKVDPKKNTLSVFTLPFENLKFVAWTQKFNGELVDSIPVGHLAIRRDFSNELYTGRNGGDFDITLFTFFNRRPDSLYHYTNGRLQPRFTMNFGNMDIPIHDYMELPHHFLGSTTVEKQIDENNFTTEAPNNYIMDKQTLKGAFYKIVNDYLGNIPVEWFPFYCQNGYYAQNWEPASLKDALDNYLETAKDLSADDRDRLQKLTDSINENDNNYVVFAKLK